MEIRYKVVLENPEHSEASYVKYIPLLNTEWFGVEDVYEKIEKAIESYFDASPDSELKFSIRKIYVKNKNKRI